MKKCMVFITSLCILFSYAMEKENKQENQWSVIVKKTKINLYKGNILDSGDKCNADFIVVEKYPKLRKNNSNQSKIQFKDKTVEVNGPRIEISPFLDVSYARYTPKYERYDARIFIKGGTYSAHTVVEAALTDLKLCYQGIFNKAVQEKNGKIAKSIALPALSIGSYKPYVLSNELENKAMQCTITTMLEFINNNPDAYDCIELFVEEEFEFNVCQKVLEVITSQ
jgi:hypothetical protein